MANREEWATALWLRGNHLEAVCLGVHSSLLCPPSVQEWKMQVTQTSKCSSLCMSCVGPDAQMQFFPVSLICYLSQHISDSESVTNGSHGLLYRMRWGACGKMVQECGRRRERNAFLPGKRLSNVSLQFSRQIPKINKGTKYDILCQTWINSVISLFYLIFLSTNCWSENRTESPHFHVNNFLTVSWWHMIYICTEYALLEIQRNGRNKVIPLSQIMTNNLSRSTPLKKQNPSLQVCN